MNDTKGLDTYAARAYRIKTFDYWQPIYSEQGFCTARSPRDRMCTKNAGHCDPLHPGHHAEDAPERVVEEWMDGDAPVPMYEKPAETEIEALDELLF